MTFDDERVEEQLARWSQEYGPWNDNADEWAETARTTWEAK